MGKEKRCRSDADKAMQFERILFEGRRLFYSHGPEGFRMQKLANRLEMSKANLYNYVTCKRDLWFAIYSEDMKRFENEIMKLINNSHSSNLDLLIDFGILYYDFAFLDKKRFYLMFESLPPFQSKDIGPYEKNLKVNSMNLLQEIINNAMEAKEIPRMDIRLLSHYFWSKIHGITTISLKLDKNFAKELKEIFFQRLKSEIIECILFNELVEKKDGKSTR